MLAERDMTGTAFSRRPKVKPEIDTGRHRDELGCTLIKSSSLTTLFKPEVVIRMVNVVDWARKRSPL